MGWPLEPPVKYGRLSLHKKNYLLSRKYIEKIQFYLHHLEKRSAILQKPVVKDIEDANIERMNIYTYIYLLYYEIYKMYDQIFQCRGIEKMQIPLIKPCSQQKEVCLIFAFAVKNFITNTSPKPGHIHAPFFKSSLTTKLFYNICIQT